MDRHAPFAHIAAPRQTCQAAGRPLIRVATTKPALIGNCKHAGQAGSQAAEGVNGHDFPQAALGRAVPYGLSDLLPKRGIGSGGASAAPPQCAVDTMARWGDTEGCGALPQAAHLLSLADAGGRKGCRPRQWTYQWQEQGRDRCGLTGTVGPYPPGGSTWHPLAHRLVSPMSMHGAGQPLRTWDLMLDSRRGTPTTTGLAGRAFLQDGVYETGRSVSEAEMPRRNVARHAGCPNWHSTMHPRWGESPTTRVEPANPEVIF